MEIIKNVIREKIRRRVLYVVSMVGLLILLLFSTGTGTITIGGKSITDYGILVPVLVNIIGFISQALAIVLSIGTIPNEYERKTSHLIWVRGIKQYKYHMLLAMGNATVSILSAFIMYAGLVLFSSIHGYEEIYKRVVPSFCIIVVNVVFISTLTSVLSIVLPIFVNGIIMTVVLIVGTFHGTLELAGSVLTGIASVLVRVILWIVPDLNSIEKQAGNVIAGRAVDTHAVLVGLLTIYVVSIFFYVFKKREA